jgi:class 3 adenylate cyclase
VPQVVFLEGEAGIGKSRLMRRMQRLAGDDGLEVIPGRCLEHFDLPYLPFRTALLPRLAAFARGEPDLAASAGLLDPALEASDYGRPDVEDTPARERAQFLHAAARATVCLGRRAPVLVTVDDLHWADDSSIDLFVQIVLEVSDAALTDPVELVIVATLRSDVHGRLGRDLGRLMREEICHRVELRPFDEAETEEFVRASGLGHASRQLVGALQHASGGNPLLLGSAVHQLREAGLREEGGELVPARSLEDLAIPIEMSSAVSDRLHGLDRDSRLLLEVAAIAGEPFTVDEIVAVSGVARERATEVLDRAVEAEILVPDQDALVFAHPMYARVLRASTQPARRREIHVAAAHALGHSEIGELDRVLRVGLHLAEAGVAADPGEAVAACQAAGERAWQLSAWGEAAGYFDAAVAATRRTDEPAVDLAELLAQAGAAHCRNLDPGPGRARLQEAISLFEQRGDTTDVVRSLLELVHLEVVWGSFLQPHDLELLESLLPRVEEVDVVLAARGYVGLAEASWPQGHVARAERHAARALELAARCDDANARTRALLARAQAKWLRLDLEGALESLFAALESGRSSDDEWLATLPLSRVALNLFWLGRLDEAREYARDALAATTRLVNFAEQSLALAALTLVEVACGRYELAEQYAEEALTAVRLSRYTWTASLVFPALVTARLSQGDVLGARSAVDQWTEIVTSMDDTSYGDTIKLVDLLVDVHADEIDRARATLAARPDLAARDQPAFIGGIQRVGALAELADALPDTPALDQWIELLDQVMGRGMLVTEGLVMLLPRVHADLCVRRSRLDEAAHGYATAIAIAERIGSAPELARAQLAYAALLREQDPESSSALAEQAARGSAALSMTTSEQEAPPPSLGRRTFALLFTDVVDSTHLTEELGDEAYFLRAQELDRRMRATIAELDGEPEDGIRPGDGLLAVFTSAEHAIRCAELAHEHAAAVELQLHVGIHVGDVIRSRTGVHGAAVNLAARICAMAPPGCTLASAALRSVAGGRRVTMFDEFGVHELKGISEPQHLFVARTAGTTS